jgi:hypothetical protein
MLPLGSASFEREVDAKGERSVWLATAVVNRLTALRGPGESYSDVILRLVELEAGQRSPSMPRPRRLSRLA